MCVVYVKEHLGCGLFWGKDLELFCEKRGVSKAFDEEVSKEKWLTLDEVQCTSWLSLCIVILAHCGITLNVD